MNVKSKEYKSEEKNPEREVRYELSEIPVWNFEMRLVVIRYKWEILLLWIFLIIESVIGRGL
jgi:hypothetical protein